MLLVDLVSLDRPFAWRPNRCPRYVDIREDHEEVAVTGVIYQEVLQGARSDHGFEALRDMFPAMLLLERGNGPRTKSLPPCTAAHDRRVSRYADRMTA